MSHIQVIFHLHGIYSCRFSTALLGVALLLISSGSEKIVEKFKLLFILAGPVVAGVMVTVLATLSPLRNDMVGQDLMLAFGETQDYVNLGVLSVSMVITTVCLIQTHRHGILDTAQHEDTTEVTKKSCPALTFSEGAACDKTEDVEIAVPDTHTYSPQMFRHTLLLMMLCCSMFSGAALSIARLGKIWDAEGEFPGVYKVLVFLDTFLASGQGLLFLAVFALDCKFILLPISKGVRYFKERVRGREFPIPTWISME